MNNNCQEYNFLVSPAIPMNNNLEMHVSIDRKSEQFDRLKSEINLQKRTARFSHYVKQQNQKVFLQISQDIRNGKKFWLRKKIASNISLFLGFFGLGCSILNEEICSRDIYLKNRDLGEYMYLFSIPSLSYALEIATTVSTALLIITVAYYYLISLKLKKIKMATNDWKLTISPYTIVKFLFEVIVLSIHPYFSSNKQIIAVQLPDGSGNTIQSGFELHSLLTILMFFRLYLLSRWLVLRHRLTNSSLTHLLGRVNEVDINFSFVLKTILQEHPWLSLFFLILSVNSIASWSLRVCESISPEEAPLANLMNSFWLIIITYLTIGYFPVFYPPLNPSQI